VDFERRNQQNENVIYVAATTWAQRNRLRSLSEFAEDNVRVVFVSSRPLNIEPAENVVIQPFLNPIGLFRIAGLHRIADSLERIVYFPSRARLYYPRVLSYLRKAIKRDLEDGRSVTVLTPSPPLDMPQVGMKLKRSFPAIRWVNDWNDLWTYDEYYLSRTPKIYHSRVFRLERELFETADLNVTTNENARNYVLDKMNLVQSRVVVIPHHINAHDEAAAAKGERSTKSSEIRLVFMGGMYKPPKVRGDKFLDALSHLRDDGVDVRLHMYSSVNNLPVHYVENREKSGLLVESPIPAEDVVSTLREYDYLVLLLEDLPNSKVIMHLKLPEYLIAGPPILAIVPGGSAVESIIKKTRTGYVLDSSEEWLEGLRQLLTGDVTRIERSSEEISKYLWRNVKVRWLAALITRID